MTTSASQLPALSRPEPLDEDVLEVSSGPEDGRLLPLATDSCTVGRAESAEICLLLDGAVSRRHARVTRTPEGYRLEDLGSTHGTLLNGQAVTDLVPLAHGDRIQVGATLLILRLKEKAGEERRDA
jgi:pSer/pThr/pTyr-binding forkhead associated (FHA) protein